MVHGHGALPCIRASENPPEVFSLLLGAVLAFAVVGVLAFEGVTVEFGGEPNRVQLWGGFRLPTWAFGGSRERRG